MFRGILAFSFQQDKQCTYNVTFRLVCLTVVAEEKQLCSECMVELRAPVSNIKILNVVQQCVYGEFISSATIIHI